MRARWPNDHDGAVIQQIIGRKLDWLRAGDGPRVFPCMSQAEAVAVMNRATLADRAETLVGLLEELETQWPGDRNASLIARIVRRRVAEFLGRA